ncbi:hypothetical protein HD553DRAFT_316423 [Filobasidium floriforme]|uniref:uncharacterized protein n=1 Tax=Filobasidium floriforme TaxID=5210 RepID=UPI001E8EB7CE|nr:uncharacterized protein HD553DRAFT_316423 [Filobasidium floriforme]KAH8080830.1 hypothetical protein HD553DRAFT_316423 [Filobasidium floriforme]
MPIAIPNTTPAPEQTSGMETLQVADLDVYRDPASSEEAKLAECKKAAESLILTGALIVRDSRATEQANETYLDMLEDYFAQEKETLEEDLRPELGYQVGATLEDTEKPSCKSVTKCTDIIAALPASERPLDITGADPKCRFFWKMSDQRTTEAEAEKQKAKRGGEFKLHDAPNVVPRAFEGVWEGRMEDWGVKMKTAVQGVGEMLSVGLGLEKDTVNDAGRYGSHLLAPTATDLRKYGKEGEIFAGFHSDMNFLTIHGRSRYPGLHIWARNSGKKIAVKVPPGCLLVQAGKQLEAFSGGLVKAGYHEVVCTAATVKAIENIKANKPDRPLIRISSTFFYHLSPEYELHGLPELVKEAERRFGPQDDYGRMTVAEQVQRELGMIALYKE